MGRFKALTMEKLHEADLLTSPIFEDVAAAISHRSQTVRLGHCDAFISHSWHDDSESKWKALQAWRSEFRMAKGREPVIWFDKACIDQNNIEADLRCLPIFMSGCKELLIFCGPTYLKRLWCIMELFTFVHMGGDIERIKLIPITRDGNEAQDREKINASFAKFDARECACVMERDRSNILSIIDAAFGDTDAFNKNVRRIIEDVGFKDYAKDSLESMYAVYLEEVLSELSEGFSTTPSPSSIAVV